MEKHIAGIIPVAGLPLDFNFPWHDCLLPVGKDYHAIERAVNTAALAGCDTIWIVLDRATQPIIRKKVGEWIYDPKFVWLHPSPFIKKREVPIYYVSIKSKDKGRRDSNGWSALYGTKVARYISKKISKWVTPASYFVVSPYGIIDDEAIKENRDLIKSGKIIAFADQYGSFKDSNPLPFTISEADRLACLLDAKEKNTGKDAGKTWNEIFEKVEISNYQIIQPNWAYNISSWDQYARFMSSGNTITRPPYLVSHKWHGLVKI
jgi:hypothetical protein